MSLFVVRRFYAVRVDLPAMLRRSVTVFDSLSQVEVGRMVA
jgi:hypothetical protein